MVTAGEAAASNDHEKRLQEVRGARVLVVDDDGDTRFLLESLLTGAGMKVACAESVARAFEVLVSFRPHVVISDIEMPVENGYSLLRNLRSVLEEDGGNTPALALTACALPGDRERALASGFDVHVGKPVAPEVLLQALVSLLLDRNKTA